MQKYLTFILALWLTVGSSCAVKAEVLHFFSDTPVEYTKHAEKSGEVNLHQESETSCQHQLQEANKQLITPISVLQAPDFPGLLISLISGLFLSILIYEQLKKTDLSNFKYSDLYSPPLYLQFQRLQFYA